MPIRQLNKLTSREVETAKDGWHADGGGLYLRVSDGGTRRRWVFRFVLHGKATEIGLGSKNAVTLKTAREKRDDHRAMVDKGLNPLAEKRHNQTKEASRKTFSQVAEAYIEREASGWSASNLSAWKRSLLGERATAKPISRLYVDEIVIEDVERAIQPLLDQTPPLKETARRTQNRIQRVLGYAVEKRFRSKDKTSVWSSVAGKRSKREKPNHHRAINWAELPDVIERIRASDSMGARALLFMILTATRVSEAREARWSEISFDKAIWVIPAERMKAGVKHDVPLSRQALAILAELKTHRTRSLFVFPGNDAREGKTRAIGRMAVWMLCKRVTDDRASPHGFRSTFRDWCGDNGKPREHAERAWAHKFGSMVEAAYARSALLSQRMPLMQAWADCACGDGERADSNVVPLRSVV